MTPPPPPAIPPPPPPVATATTGALPARVTGVACPSCGGALEVDSGARVVRCAFCSAGLLATSRLGVRRFAVAPEVDVDAARDAARSWLGRGIRKDPRLAREAEIGETYLAFLPFFRVSADVVGWALGTEQRTRSVGSGKNRRTETYEVDVEKRVERHCEATMPALHVAELGVQRIDLAGDRLVPFDAEALERSGMVFVPTRSEVEARDAALAAFRDDNDPASGLHRVRFRWLETVREALTVVYYPLWMVRYRFRGRAYLAVVDAEDAHLAYGKAPGNDLYRAAVLIGAEAVVCYAGTTALQVMEGSIEGCGFVAAGAAVVVAWAWRAFRHGGVVEEGSGLERRPLLPGSVRSLFGGRKAAG
jgi:LSD1 subclass zinc finger protein